MTILNNDLGDLLPFNHYDNDTDFHMAIAQLNITSTIDNNRWKSLLLNPTLIKHHQSFSALTSSHDPDTEQSISPSVIAHDYTYFMTCGSPMQSLFLVEERNFYIKNTSVDQLPLINETKYKTYRNKLNFLIKTAKNNTMLPN